ncbi:MAG: trigger factor [Oscillospiraceae bacterium]|nr:trigger factor [Oscillospiraceae bacterium]
MLIKSSEKKENNMVELIVEVSNEEFDTAINDTYKKKRSSISIPGFRKGKAPRKIVEAMYGKSIFHSDALDIIVPDVLEFALGETDLRLVGYPQVTDVDIKDDGGLDVSIDVAEYPEVTLAEYRGLSAVKQPVLIEEWEVDEEIEAVRLRNARSEKVERPAIIGDTVVIDFEGFIDEIAFENGKAEDYPLLLGSNNFIPGFEEKLLGMVPDEERDLDLVFPEDYSEELAGKDVLFKVKLKELREQILPDIDDEFAKDISEFDTMEEYKTSIRERLNTARQSQSDADFENSLLEQLIESMEADIPEVMIELQLENATNNFARQIASYGMDPATYLQMTGTNADDLIANLRVSSEKQVKTMLALNKIVELEGIEVTEEDIESEYEQTAESYNMEVDKLKETLSSESLTDDLKMKRAAKIIIDSAIALDPPEPSDEVLEDEAEAEILTIEDSPEQEKKTSTRKRATVKKSEATDEVDDSEKKSTKSSSTKAKATSEKASTAKASSKASTAKASTTKASTAKASSSTAKTATRTSRAKADTKDTDNVAVEEIAEKAPASRRSRKAKDEDAT